MKSFRSVLAMILTMILVLSLVMCSSNVSGFKRTGYVLGTICTIRLADGGSEKLLDEVFARLAQIEDELSVNKLGSQIDAVNEAAGMKSVVVGDDALAIIRRDLDLCAWSNGSFDPTVRPLIALWGIGTDIARVPSDEEIIAARRLVGWKNMVVDYSQKSVFLRNKGMRLDLGSTTKGFAADEIAQIIRKAGVKSAIIDLGGNILVIGSRRDGKPWRVGLRNPFSDERGDCLGIANLVDKTMVTSGVNERFFIKDGKRYHHILDTSTGYPVDNGLMSVTIIAKKSFDADGFTTTVFTLGREKGMALAREKGVDVIIVDANKKVYLSPGVSSFFEITDPAFSIGN